MKKLIALLLLVASLAPCLRASPGSDLDSIYQYFAPSSDGKSRPNLGAYLWIPPHTPQIRAVMVAMHNGLPINILQHPAIRAVCRKHGIAQILFTPWAKDIGGVMMKNLKYDATDPESTGVYDGYIKRLADLSGHPELVGAPIVPLAHSAFCDFPFDAAMRKPEQCLATIPIKAGLPDGYSFYAAGGKAHAPDPAMSLRYVPILFVTSASQETVGWSAYPHALNVYGVNNYRRDHDDNPGTDYEPRNELFGGCWEMNSGHFDMYPRDYQFVADWLDAIAAARLPGKAGDPLRNMTLRDGWLMCPNIPATGDLPKDYPMPARYLEYKGHRNQALWFPTESLARRLFEMGRDEPRKEMEMFTIADAAGQPVSLAYGSMASLPNPQLLVHDDGLLTLTTWHYTTPPMISTIPEKEHKAHPGQPEQLANVLFPGRTTMPLSGLPLQFDPHGGAFELVRAEQFNDSRGVTETHLVLRMVRHRIDPGAGFVMSFVRVFHEGNDRFAAAGRTCQISLSPGDVLKSGSSQTVDFPPVPDAPGTASRIDLKCKSSSGLPVDYFVTKGPGVVRDGAFIPTEIPAGADKPIEVTVGAYQVGLFKEHGAVKPSDTVFQTFHLVPPFPN